VTAELLALTDRVAMSERAKRSGANGLNEAAQAEAQKARTSPFGSIQVIKSYLSQ
jgi:hypothetical protein